MTEFIEVMKRWRKMCGRMMCGDCPLQYNSVCGELDIATDKEIEEAKNSILGWKDDKE